MRRRLLFLILVAVLLLLPVLWAVFPRGPRSPDDLLAERGRLTGFFVVERTAGGGRVTEELLLESDTGLEIRARVHAPPAAGIRYPAVVLIGGIRTGRTVIDRIPAGAPPMVWMSIDYLYRPPAAFPDVGSVARALPEADRGAVRTLSALCLALDYLEARPDVDTTRTLLAGGSLGAFFAVVGGSLEPRFDAVASLYGGGDLVRIVEENLPWPSPWLRKTVSRALNPWLGPVDPSLFAPRIAPRPFLMVNGARDTRIPRECALDLERAAREPKEILWLDTAHRIQDEAALMGEATEAVLGWLRKLGWIA